MLRSLLLLLILSSASAYSNVYGEPLQSCSSGGMALTGYTRTGHCVSDENDNGSHHVCIDLSSTSGGDFCSVTGQPDWCSSSAGCHGDQSAQTCQIKNWCVCEWAFASYIGLAGGCDAIQDLKCDAINVEVIAAYQGVSSQQKYKDALACIVKRCSISGVSEG